MKKLTKAIALSLVVMMLAFAAGCTAAAPASTATTPAATTSGAPTSLDRIKSAGKLVMLTNCAFPPFEYIMDNKPAGVDVDICEEIAKDMGVTLEVVDMDFNGIIASVQQGRGDLGAAGMTVNDERRQQVDFSIEYVKSAQYVIIRKGSGVTVDSLKDKKIGVQEGTTGDFYATDDIMMDANTDSVMRYKNAIIASQDLMNGRVDAVIIDKLPAESIVAANADKLELIAEPLTEESYAVCVKKDSPELLAAINGTLDRLMKEGRIDEFVVRHVKGE